MTDEEIASHKKYWQGLLKATRRDSFKAVLKKLPRSYAKAPRNSHLEEWVSKATGLSGRPLEEWYQRAWHGCIANQVVGHRIRVGRYHEMVEFCAPPDLRSLQNIVDEGKGLFLVGCHLGPKAMARLMLVNSGMDILYLANGRQSFSQNDPGRVISAKNTGDRRAFMLEALARVRNGGVVYAAADGRASARGFEATFMNHKIAMGSGIMRLIRASKVPSVAVAAAWHSQKGIHLNFYRLPDCHSDAGDEWEREWMKSYIRWMEGLLEMPENLRLLRKHTFLGLPPMMGANAI